MKLRETRKEWRYGFSGESRSFALLPDSSLSLIALKDCSSSSASDVMRDMRELVEATVLDYIAGLTAWPVLSLRSDLPV